MKNVILISVFILSFLLTTNYSYAQTTTPSLTPTTTPTSSPTPTTRLTVTPTPTSISTLPDAGISSPTILLTSIGVGMVLFSCLLFSLSKKSD